jgi:NTE family protein
MDTKAGEPIEQARLDADLRRIYGTGDFERVGFRLIESPTERILNVEAIEKNWGPNYLKFGLGLSSDFSGNSYFSVLGQYRRTWMNSYGGEWRTNVALGRPAYLESEFYQPLDATQRFFIAPRVEIESNYYNIYQRNDPIAEYGVGSIVGGVDLGTGFTRYGEIRLGLYGGVARADYKSGERVLNVDDRQTVVGVRLRGYFDQLDNIFFPRNGYAGNVTLFRAFEALGSDRDYDRWEAGAVGAVSFGANTFQVGLAGAGPITSGGDAVDVPRPWGGFLQQSGYASGQLLNRRFVFGRLIYMRKLLDIPLLEGLYGGFSAEVGSYGPALVQGNPTGTLTSGSAFFALDSPIGPLYLGYGVGQDNNRSAYFYLGRP